MLFRSEIVQRQADSDDAKRAITMTVAQADGVKPKAEPMAIPGKPTKAAPKVEADEEEEAPAPKASKKAAPKVEAEDDAGEPEVRKSAEKPNAVPAKKSKLADIVADWDDEA